VSRTLSAAGAIAVLNASLAFLNVWPTPAFLWSGQISVECAVFLFLMLAAERVFGMPSRATIHWMAGVWVLLTLGHYADVTAPALYGRDINLYWDIRYMPDVAAMIAHAVPLWIIVCVAAAVFTAVALLYLLFRWAIGRVADAAAWTRGRIAIAVVAAAMLTGFVAQKAGVVDAESMYPTPVTQTYARQLRLIAGALGASHTLEASPKMDAGLELVRDADVFLIFI